MPHFCWLKSSAKDAGTDVLVFELLVLVLAVRLLLRLSLRVFAFKLLFVFDPRLANAISMTSRPTPMMITAASPPSIHHTAFDFFCGAACGAGRHCCGGGGAGVAGLGAAGGAGR